MLAACSTPGTQPIIKAIPIAGKIVSQERVTSTPVSHTITLVAILTKIPTLLDDTLTFVNLALLP